MYQHAMSLELKSSVSNLTIICHLHISLIPAAVAASSKTPLCDGETNEVLMNKNPLESSKEDFYIFLSVPLLSAIINWVRDYKPCWLSV